MQIDPITLSALLIETFSNDIKIDSATGFVALYKNKRYLVTNWHVLSGRNPETNNPFNSAGKTPDNIKIWMHVEGNNKGTYKWVEEPRLLFDKNGKRKWLEHKKGGRNIDVALLPLPNPSPQFKEIVNTVIIDVPDPELFLPPSEPISIIGFPLGKPSYGYFPIWKTGHIASDLDVDYQGKPVFLIDATTRGGMSGSPVIARRSGMYNVNASLTTVGAVNKFLGVYSGRMGVDENFVNIGLVWKSKVISEILEFNT